MNAITKATLGRLGGPAFVLAGVLWLAFAGLQAFAPAALDEAPYTVLNPTADFIYKAMVLLAVTLFALGLLGLYARQAGTGGPVAVLGAAVALVGGLVFATAGVLTAYFDVDGAWNVMAISALVLALDLPLLGIPVLTGHALGRWSIVPLLVGGVLVAVFAGGFTGLYAAEGVGAWLGATAAVLVGVGWIALGAALRAGSERPTGQRVLSSAPVR